MKTTRRNFLRTGSLALASLAMPGGIAKSEILESQVKPLYRVRRSVNMASAANDLALYKKAVEVMKTRPKTDPKSWEFQASIHNNFCPHRNWFFLPWHRAYLYYFEQICREACGDSGFNLPYWDWTQFPQIPAAFWGASNPLMDATRSAGPTSTASSEFIGKEVIDSILEIKDFEEFASYRSSTLRGPSSSAVLEGTPHNYIHRFVLGNMASLMSPLDPIFWLHHANIDRIWATWNDLNNPNSADPAYADVTFFDDIFYNTSGTRIKIKPKELSSERKLGYIYDSQQQKTILVPPIATKLKKAILSNSIVTNDKLVKKLQVTDFLVESTPLKANNSLQFIKANSLKKQKKSVKLIVGDIEPPLLEDFYVRIFLNCDYLDRGTPINDPHYVNSFTFFSSNHSHDHGNGMHHDHNNSKLSFTFDITKTLEKLASTSGIESIQDKLDVQLLAIPFKEKDEAVLLPGKIEVLLVENG